MYMEMTECAGKHEIPLLIWSSILNLDLEFRSFDQLDAKERITAPHDHIERKLSMYDIQIYSK